MSMNQCPNGHLYDSDLNVQCPYCAMAEKRKGESMYPVYPMVPNVPINFDSASSMGAGKNHDSISDELPYVFISYAHADSNEVLANIEYLKQNHFNVWYDEGIKSGREWADEISMRIKHCKQFICFISRHSVNSESVKDEIHIAWKYNINTIVVYLEKIDLDGGLEMKLDRKQAILKYTMSEPEFKIKMSSSISQEVVQIKNDKAPNDIRLNDRYDIIRVLSKGGTATTYLAKNKMTGVNVVLKHGTYDETVSGQRIKSSFEREKNALSKNISPFIPALYDYFYDSSNIYIAESYIDGEAINKMAWLSLYDKIEMFIKVAKVIKELHQKGIYHCDIKPEHIIVNHHGCFLIDFGSIEDSNSIVSEDIKMGTVTYAAPEQFVSYNGENDIFGNYKDASDFGAQEKNIDERTDIYALGRTMIKVIFNNGKFEREVTTNLDVTTALFANVTQTISRISDNPLLQAIIEKMVREKKSNRYRNMDEVIRVLEDFLKIYK